MQLRRSSERGLADHGWLRSFHTFSFAGYNDPKHMGFGPLRVINEDRVAPGRGFGRHGHRDMEIISYVLEGELAHSDSMGTGSVIRPGDVQHMSAGTGVMHAEFNHSQTEPVHFLQIWIVPDRTGHAPRYQQQHFTDAEKRGRLCLVASGDGRERSIQLHQDASLYAGRFDGPEQATHLLEPRRSAWVQVVRGSIALNGLALQTGDAAAVDAGPLDLRGGQGAEVLLFDLPGR